MRSVLNVLLLQWLVLGTVSNHTSFSPHRAHHSKLRNVRPRNLAAKGPCAEGDTRLLVEQQPRSVGGPTNGLAAVQKSEKRYWHERWVKISVALVMFFAIVVGSVIYVWQQRVLGKAVENYIRQIDKEVIGVDVHMDSLWINPVTWSVHIKNLLVENPTGYKSQYLAKADKVILAFDVFQYVATKGVRVHIRKMIFRRIHVNYEKTLKSSNVKDIVHFLYYGTGTTELPPSGRLYSLEQVLMEDIKVMVVASMLRKGMRLPIADVRYSNFAEEVGDFLMYDVARLLLQGLMKQVLGSNASVAPVRPRGSIDDLAHDGEEEDEEDEEDVVKSAEDCPASGYGVTPGYGSCD